MVNLKDAFIKKRIRAIDYYFAEFINNKKKSSLVALSACLVSFKNASGAVCIDLEKSSNKVFFRGDDFDGVKTPSLSIWLEALKTHPWVSEKKFPSPLILDGYKLYLGKYWQYEQALASTILKKNALISKVNEKALIKAMTYYFPIENNQLDWQAVSAFNALHNNFLVITGGPGTGKTTTVTKILALLLTHNKNAKIVLSAPTGKAATRLSESIKWSVHIVEEHLREKIPTQAHTIHRLLKNDSHTGTFIHNKQHPLIMDILVVDEASMIDLVLMSQLFDAIPKETKVILLGDKDQLSSVEAGSVLDDITGRGVAITYPQKFFSEQGVNAPTKYLNNGKILAPLTQSITVLQKSYRFDGDSGIGQLARLVNQKKGEVAFNTILKNDLIHDCKWLSVCEAQHQEKLIKLVCQQYQSFIEQQKVEDALVAFEKTRVLCAVQEGYCGVNQLNEQIKSFLVRKRMIEGNNNNYHAMPIMITQNDYESDLFNGDIGLLWQDENGLLFAYFIHQGTLKKVNLARLPSFVPAYALTIHKSQGSEFENVFLVLPDYTSKVLNKALVYTGVTRAKKQLIVVSDKKSFISACNTTIQRESGLAEKLGW